MTEYCFQLDNTKTIVSDVTKIFSFILSHPLYFSYFIFFSPYLIKLLSFLSPLFFTTSLLLLSLFTTLIPLHSIINSNEGFLLTAYNTLLENSHPESEEESGKSTPIEEFEVYKVVFEIPTIEQSEEKPVENEQIEETPVDFEKIQEHPLDYIEEKVTDEGRETGYVCESLSMKEGEKVYTKPKAVKKVEELKKKESKRESEATKTVKSMSLRHDEGTKLGETFSQTFSAHPYMGSFGSMRREKEWRRTLACKLFEERHNGGNNNGAVNGGRSEEGMDMLWETYETELLNKGKANNNNNNNNKLDEISTKKGKKIEDKKIDDLMMVNEEEDDYYDDNGKLCCLQALKLSAGKMNLSMGMRISKAFKGFGLLQNHVKKKGKKGYK